MPARPFLPTAAPSRTPPVTSSWLTCGIEVVELGPAAFPTGAPRRLTDHPICSWGNGLAWTRDGKSLVYFDCLEGIRALAPLDRGRSAAGTHRAGRAQGRLPALAASRDRLAFQRDLADEDIYRFETGRPPQPVLASSLEDSVPSFSPDGRRVAFSSQRSETPEIWLADADGSRPVRLTHGPGNHQGTPRWSPDGRRITLIPGPRTAIGTSGPSTSTEAAPRRLTQDPGDENMPSWSRDGRLSTTSRAETAAPTSGGCPPWGNGGTAHPSHGRAAVRIGRWADALFFRTGSLRFAASRPADRRRPGASGGRLVPRFGFAVGPTGISTWVAGPTTRRGLSTGSTPPPAQSTHGQARTRVRRTHRLSRRQDDPLHEGSGRRLRLDDDRKLSLDARVLGERNLPIDLLPERREGGEAQEAGIADGDPVHEPRRAFAQAIVARASATALAVFERAGDRNWARILSLPQVQARTVPEML